MPALVATVTLVGEANPYGTDPRFALYPSPDGCSGHRLCCKVLGMRRADYLREFDRVNLCPQEWSAKIARAEADRLKCFGNRRVLLGAKVAKAFGFEYRPFTVETYGVLGTKRALLLPHPSGLSRAWNDVGSYQRARVAVAEFAPHLADLLGVID